MKLLSDYKNLLVFDFIPNRSNVNVVHEIIKDFDIDVDIELCSHCFYDSKKKPQLNIKKDTSKGKNKTTKRVSDKKNKSTKK